MLLVYLSSSFLGEANGFENSRRLLHRRVVACEKICNLFLKKFYNAMYFIELPILVLYIKYIYIYILYIIIYIYIYLYVFIYIYIVFCLYIVLMLNVSFAFLFIYSIR